MKYKKYIFLILVIIGIFWIYKLNSNNKIYYISLGDSLAAGQNPYGEIGYGYSDYVNKYLKSQNLVEFYSKDFAKSGDRIIDLINKIEKNEKVELQDKELRIQTAIEKADVITLSIGANDLFEHAGLNDMNYNLEKLSEAEKYLDEISENLDKLIKLIRKYNNNKIILVGYYNPLSPLSSKYTRELEPLFMKVNEEYEKVAIKNKCDYIDVYEIFKENPEYLPNPTDIHPSNSGYEVISAQIIDILKKSNIN